MARHYRAGEDVFHDWRDRVQTGRADPVYLAGEGDLARFPIAPGRVTLLGGAPGQGKTALAMQVVLDALRLNEKVRACVCNIEMSPEALLDRQLARVSGIELSVIRERRFGGEHSEPLDAAFGTIESVAERLCFVEPPFDLTTVAAAADATESGLLVLDYIQRIRPPGVHGDKRGSVDATMDYLRQFAAEEMAVLVISSVARTKDKKGRSAYDAKGLNLASFRESSELEYGADDAFIIVPDGDDEDHVVLRHLKARHDECCDIRLEFDRPLQRFIPADGDGAANNEVTDQIRRAWKSTLPSREGGRS